MVDDSGNPVPVDYTTETFEPLMEHEVNGLDCKMRKYG